MTKEITLNCIVDGDSTSFPVDVVPEKSIGHLKDAIHAKKSKTFHDIDADKLTLWRVEIPDQDEERAVVLDAISDKKKLNERAVISTLDLTGTNTFVIVHRRQQIPSVLRKKWTVNGTIRFHEIQSIYYVDPTENGANDELLSGVSDCKLIMFIGARASGKSTRLFRLAAQLAEAEYHCLIVSFERVNIYDDNAAFWTSFGKALRVSLGKDLQNNSGMFETIGTSDDFLAAFSCDALSGDRIVLLIDEFDLLHDAGVAIRDQCLQIFQEIQQNNSLYAIDSIIVCGTFGLQHLATSRHAPPFNVDVTVKSLYFTQEQTQRLFNEYAADKEITIDDDIVRDIFWKSNGHPGMICLCGQAIHDNLRSKVNESTKNLDYRTWQDFSIDYLNGKILSHHTFRRIVDSLSSNSATDSVNLLRIHFVGYLGDVSISDLEHQILTDFLTAEGVLIKHDDKNYCMASAFIDSFVKRYIIPTKYPQAPSKPASCYQEPLDVPDTLTAALQFFDKDLIRQAGTRKTAKIFNFDFIVPGENVYETELMRVLTNWLIKIERYEVTAQWHLCELENHRYNDIVIKKAGKPTVVIELLATESQTSIKDHISKMLSHKRLLSADEAWVVHFTVDREYHEDPHWQTDEELDQGMNLMHIWHDFDFETIQRSARWRDEHGHTQRLEDIKSFKTSFFSL
ncbi:hypothetical protein BGZ80_000336 [Entomortierella chlamydospora]|uniref:Crinkler effector protein N-terminal domain-containing protein n=1 Tax=Entomortierella chlamydospora TaxID=101097 RepID=A0A9P6MSC8_9FUNG|nr:hypothetical protein BGZ80_000336 [Entomortierella chlamydospora]